MTGKPALVSATSAFTFVLILGIVNLFADFTYEGGAAINGQYLAGLGASAFAISAIAGLGEFLGYALRSIAGYAADKTGKYWLITFAGYTINLLAVPAMALAGNWQVAALLILAERIGRAFRKPTIEAMLSYSTGKHGKGWVYSLNTALDETGAALGPLLVAGALYMSVDFRTTYALLLISSALAIGCLVLARLNFPLPEKLEEGGPSTASQASFTRAYWLYMIGGGFFAAGLMSFELVAYHLSSSGAVTEYRVPLFLALATLSAIVASLVLGRLYDRIGIPSVIVGVLIASAFSPFVFFGDSWIAMVGMLFWGVGYAVQDTMLKVLIASVLPRDKRNMAFGSFYLGYGGGWLIGSIVTGLLYGRSHAALVVFAITAQLLSLPFFLFGSRLATDKGGGTRNHKTKDSAE